MGGWGLYLSPQSEFQNSLFQMLSHLCDVAFSDRSLFGGREKRRGGGGSRLFQIG